MDYYARECHCKRLVKYNDDGEYLHVSSPILESGYTYTPFGYFLVDFAGRYKSIIYKALKGTISVMYCSVGHTLYLRKFTKVTM